MNRSTCARRFGESGTVRLISAPLVLNTSSNCAENFMSLFRITSDQILEIILQMAVYAGSPRRWKPSVRLRPCSEKPVKSLIEPGHFQIW